MFILASSVCKSPQCLISALTHGGEGGHFFRLTRSLVLRGGRNIAIKCPWRVWGVRVVYRPLWVCPSSQCVLSWSTLLRLQVALQGNRPKRALGCMHFPGLSCSGSGSRVLHKGADWLGLRFEPFPGSGAEETRCLMSTLSQVCSASHHLPGPSCSVSWVRHKSTVSAVPSVPSGG